MFMKMLSMIKSVHQALSWLRNSQPFSEPDGSLLHWHLRQCPLSWAFLPHFFKVHFNIILPATARPSTWSLFFGFWTKTVYILLISYMPATCHAHLIHFDLVAPIIFGEQYWLWTCWKKLPSEMWLRDVRQKFKKFGRNVELPSSR
jgi:hypothetical protein